MHQVAQVGQLAASSSDCANGSAFAQSLGTCKLGVCDPVPIGDPSVQQLVANGSIEYPNLVTWFTPAIAFFNPTLARCGKMSMTLPGGSGANAQTINQSLSIPGMVTHIYLDFWLFEPWLPPTF